MYCCISQCVINFNETFVFIFEFSAALINLEFIFLNTGPVYINWEFVFKSKIQI